MLGIDISHSPTNLSKKNLGAFPISGKKNHKATTQSAYKDLSFHSEEPNPSDHLIRQRVDNGEHGLIYTLKKVCYCVANFFYSVSQSILKGFCLIGKGLGLLAHAPFYGISKIFYWMGRTPTHVHAVNQRIDFSNFEKASHELEKIIASDDPIDTLDICLSQFSEKHNDSIVAKLTQLGRNIKFLHIQNWNNLSNAQKEDLQNEWLPKVNTDNNMTLERKFFFPTLIVCDQNFDETLWPENLANFVNQIVIGTCIVYIKEYEDDDGLDHSDANSIINFPVNLDELKIIEMHYTSYANLPAYRVREIKNQIAQQHQEFEVFLKDIEQKSK